jgi:hypothetical protein
MEISRIIWSGIIEGIILKFFQLALEFTRWGACCVVPVIANAAAAMSIFVGPFPCGELGNVGLLFDHVGVHH